jgi:hypothetical protein
MNCLWCFFCIHCGRCPLNTDIPYLKVEEIHQYIPFEGKVESNVYYEALKLKQKLEGRRREKNIV